MALRALCTAALLACAAGAAAGDNYTATPVPPLNGGVSTVAYGVNDAGWVVGQADQNGVLVGFVFHNGQTTALPLLTGGSDGKAASINSGGVVVGECRNLSGVSRPVKWQQDGGGVWQITDLGTLAAGDVGFGVATRINDAGQITGYASIASPGPYHGFVWTNGVKVDLRTLNFSGNNAYSQALGINSGGDASGFAYATLQGPEHGMFVASGGRGQDITPPGQFGLAQWHNVNDSQMLGGYVSGTLTAGAFRPATWDSVNGIVLLPIPAETPEGFGYDINNAGAVVGGMFLLNGNPEESVFHGFVSAAGVTTDLNTVSTGQPGNISEARDVANNGMIAATSDTASGPQAVLLTPAAPCPADFNGDGQVDFFDYLDFVQAFANEDPSADFNHDGQVDFFDYLDFAAAFSAGCN